MTATPTVRLWRMSIEVTFEADNAEDASSVASRLTTRALEHPSTWNVNGEFEPEQTPETVEL